MAPVASPADVSAGVPHLCAQLHLQHVEEGVLEGFSRADALGWLIRWHALNDICMSISTYLSLCIYIYIYIYVCICISLMVLEICRILFLIQHSLGLKQVHIIP